MLIYNNCLQYHQSVINNAKEAEKAQPGRPLAIALDTVRHSLIHFLTLYLCGDTGHWWLAQFTNLLSPAAERA